MVVMSVVYNKDTLASYLMYSKPIQFNEAITLYPITMDHVLEFQRYSRSLTFRKDSRFGVKEIIKMTYLEFLFYTAMNPDVNDLFEDTPDLSYYFAYALSVLGLVCVGQDIDFNNETGGIRINGYEINADEFDDIRRIIILQNGMNFDIDEFLNYETEKSLENAQKKISKNSDIVTTEDYIDALIVALHLSENEIQQMSIRKFWRIVKRQSFHETYTILKTGECSGMVKFKEPIKHWIRSIDEEDKYAHLKADEGELRNKIG